MHDLNGTVFDSKCRPNAADCELGILESLIRGIVRAEQVDKIEFNLPEKGDPSDHGQFYSLNENKIAFDFLNLSESRSLLRLFDFNLIKVNLVYDEGDLPFVARASNENWPELKWGLQSISGKNPFPHPLA